MRLVRYQGLRDIWGCRDCGAETPLLDCPCCERRGVHLARRNAGGNTWECLFCGNRRQQCRHCGKGWVAAVAAAPAVCSHCAESA
jgi:hypothetical protein